MKFNLPKIKEIRAKYKISQEELAFRLKKCGINIDQSGISRKESSVEGKITVKELVGIAKALELDLSEFFDFDGNEPILKYRKNADKENPNGSESNKTDNPGLIEVLKKLNQNNDKLIKHYETKIAELENENNTIKRNYKKRGIGFEKEVIMPKVTPFHSKLSGTRVHHNNNKCTEGNNIESHNRKSGTGGHPLCERCKRRNAEGK